MEATTFTNTGSEAAAEFAATVQEGDKVAGREVFNRFGVARTVTVWGNGTVSFKVRQRGNPNRDTDLFVKVGQTVSVVRGR